jgi:hypothetical protein
MSHHNAPLTPAGRLRLVRCQYRPIADIAGSGNLGRGEATLPVGGEVDRRARCAAGPVEGCCGGEDQGSSSPRCRRPVRQR